MVQQTREGSLHNQVSRWFLSGSKIKMLEDSSFHFLFLRFPGGESYKDLIRRLESVVVDLEQQVIPVLVVSHVSVLQMLIAYFRKSPIEKCMNIEVPLHTAIKFTPSRGGGWSESQHTLTPAYTRCDSFRRENYKFEGIERVGRHETPVTKRSPIWGDHLRKSSSTSIGNQS